MTENEKAYWDKRDRIIDADFIWLAQRHVTNALESLRERGYDKNSDTVRQLQSIIDRLSKLAAVVQTGLEEEAYKKEDAIHDQHLLEEETQAEHDLDVNCIRYAGAP